MYGDGSWASLVKGFSGTPEWVNRFVPCTTLENFGIDRFVGKKLFIKIDAEGSENMILEGATKFLALNPKPIWFVETIRDSDYMAVFEKFWKFGYKSSTANKEINIYSQEDVENYMKNSHVFNFLFLE